MTLPHSAMIPRLSRYIPYAIAFTLPLGFYGEIGVAGAALFALWHWRDAVKLGWRPVLVALPFAVITVLAALFSPDPAHSFLPALGMAVMFTLGLQAARVVAHRSDADTLMLAFVAGTLVLAGSVVLDFAMGQNRLPSGLFHGPTLHNWAGAYFALAFPLALYLSRQRQLTYRIFGASCLIAFMIGATSALSWVGGLGIIVGTIIYGALQRNTLTWLVPTILLGALAILSMGRLAPPQTGGNVSVRNFQITDLEQTIRGRFSIFVEGVRLALQRPILGWGWAENNLSIADRGNHRNLLRSSQSFGRLPWYHYGLTVKENVESAPDSSLSADLVKGMGIQGQRLAQLVSDITGKSLAFTFSVWVRSKTDQSELVALKLRDPRDPPSKNNNVVSLIAHPKGTVLNHEAAEFSLTSRWERIWIVARFRKEPVDGIQAIIYPGGYYRSQVGQPEVDLWGAQLETGNKPQDYVTTSEYDIQANPKGLSHFHNLFIQAFFETGLLGLSMLVAFLFYMWLQAKASRLRNVIRATMAGFLVTQMFDYATVQSSITMGFLLVIVLSYSTNNRFGLNTVLRRP